jgi:Protein of unknown function (DUF4232)
VSYELERLGAFPVCSASQLDPSVTLPARSAGRATVSFSFRDRSDSICRLSGFPRLRLLDARGHLLRTTVTRLGAAYVRRQGLGAEVVLDPQESAAFGVTWSPCTTPRAVRAHVTLPGGAGRFALAVGTRLRPLAPCDGHLSVSSLA